MKDMLKYSAVSVSLLTPVLAFAQFGEIDTFFGGMTNFIQNTLIPLLIAIAFIMFVYGAIKYFLIASSDEGEGKREEGKQLMLWGIIAFVIIVSVWGIVSLISSGLGFDNDRRINTIPDAPDARSSGGG